jgi:hypothetical protein
MNFHNFSLIYWTGYFKNLSIDSHDFLCDIEKNLKEVINFVNRRDNSELPSYDVDENMKDMWHIYFRINFQNCSLKMKESTIKKLVSNMSNIRNLMEIQIYNDNIILYSKDLYKVF